MTGWSPTRLVYIYIYIYIASYYDDVSSSAVRPTGNIIMTSHIICTWAVSMVFFCNILVFIDLTIRSPPISYNICQWQRETSTLCTFILSCWNQFKPVRRYSWKIQGTQEATHLWLYSALFHQIGSKQTNKQTNKQTSKGLEQGRINNLNKSYSS